VLTAWMPLRTSLLFFDYFFFFKFLNDRHSFSLSLSLASIKSRQGQVDEAEAIFLETIATLKKQDKPEVLQGLSMYQQHLLAHKKADKAKEVKAEISSIQQALKAQKQQRK